MKSNLCLILCKLGGIKNIAMGGARNVTPKRFSCDPIFLALHNAPTDGQTLLWLCCCPHS
jgi:hypothetical protein